MFVDDFFESLQLVIDQRQLRLFAVACCRDIWRLLTHKCCQDAVEIAEQFADGLATKNDLRFAKAHVWNIASDSEIPRYLFCAAHACALVMTWQDAWDTSYSAKHADKWREIKIRQETYLKDITSKPSIKFNSSLLLWNNSLLSKFATNIYANKDFSLMPILADALEEANAPDTFIQHCHEKIHVKGCWLLDVLMGKR